MSFDEFWVYASGTNTRKLLGATNIPYLFVENTDEYFTSYKYLINKRTDVVTKIVIEKNYELVFV